MEETFRDRGELLEALERQGVVAAYLFGSVARQDPGPLSDVDLAVVFSDDVPLDEQFDRSLRIVADIGALVGRRVDVINLVSTPSALLKHRAVFSGIEILNRDPRRLRAFQRRVLQDYEDTCYLRSLQGRGLRRQLAEGTFGRPLVPPYRDRSHGST